MSSTKVQGESFGRYNVLRRIGTGGMAEVFLARATGALGTEKSLVIKKIHPALASNRKFIEMFVDEARVAMRLNHSNIVQVYALEQIGDHHILAMEHVDGADLQRILISLRGKKVRLPEGLCAYIVAEAAKGLDYAHSRRDDRGEPMDIVHRDVSPQNTLISRDGLVKVTDFGIARARSLSQEEAGNVVGKVGYMAPEQARAEAVDRRADIYSLGVMLYEMVVGEPFPRGEEELKEVPEGLAGVVERAVARDPKERYGTARQMAQDLGVFLHSMENIFDSHTLENWLDSNLPPKVMGEPGPEAGKEDLAPSDDGDGEDDETMPMRALGEVEKRPVVMVTARLSSEFNEDDTVSSEFSRLAGEIAYKADGVLTETSDEVRVFLGLEASAMEDAIRALRLAHDLMDVVRALSRDHQVEIGASVSVNRGLVMSRQRTRDAELSFQPERDLTLGARQLLAMAQDGEILAGGGVYRLARKEYNFSEPRTDKKNAGPGEIGVKAYLVHGARSREQRERDGTSSGVFRGREEDLERLEEIARKVKGGHVGLVRVVGEIGIGKSRLVRRFLEDTKGQVTVVDVECLFAERDSPISTAAAAYRAALDLKEDEPVKGLREKMAPLLKSAPKYLGRQVSFLERVLESADLMWAKAGDDRRDLVRRTAFGLGVVLAKHAQSKPVVLVVENAQWMDGQSVDVLSELASHAEPLPVMVVLVGYPETLAERKIEGLESLELKELSEDHVRQIVLERLGSSPGMQGIADQITARAQGNPFFASEIIDSLVERGLLESSGTEHGAMEYSVAEAGAIRLPTTMEGLAASQINSVESRLRTTLRVASAVGSVFTVQTLCGLSGRDVSQDVAALVEQGFLVGVPGSGSDTEAYRFKRSMMREAAYGGLSTQDRHRIHKALAEDLVAKKALGEPVPSARIAWHLEHGTDPGAAATYYFHGGEAAMAVYSNRRALRLFERALSLLDPGDDLRFLVLDRRERALKDLGHHEERVKNVEEMDHLATRSGDEGRLTRVANLRAQLEYDRARFRPAAAAVSTGLKLAQRSGDLKGRVESLRLLAYIAMEAGHMVRARRCCDEALELLQGDEQGVAFGPYYRGRVLGIKGLVFLYSGELELAPACLAEALVIFKRLGKRRNESTVMSNLALLAQARGDLMEAVDFLERAILIDVRNRDVSARGRKLVAAGCIRVELGDFDEAKKLLEEGGRICEDNQEPLGQAEAELGLAELRLTRGDLTGAGAVLDDPRTRRFAGNSRILMVRHAQLRSKLALASGESARAFEAAKEATLVAKEAGMIGEVVHGAAAGGVALSDMGEQEAAVDLTNQVETLIHSTGGVRRAEEIWWCRGLTLHRAGKDEEAAKALARARREMERKSVLIGRTWLRMAYNNHPFTQRIVTGYR